ncbi:TIGR03557 family F420-dependent LLM class oxidoreductase [Phytoactinopolyspora alkaliphila]|uniref:TIGR03557 family F420-dependent LLM class oxidoreductase n=1 Tax=Phytoactinopolyspora alkaliphila TaxID=1783498 RepID=A0A6N9YHC9_9ACTN|nr:TIGR03557 family F420-dependent LLM class oxidoreductase [Phytoactinopolyspora alkaliphila]NED94337.1 TIGR03557 family F420-dependent LLM class oxidoreductase [Phytoactinopolyspora alkaliphila]
MSGARVGYAAMLERFHPSDVTDLAVEAERAGFDGVMADDHFQPWTPRQGHAGFVWNVMTAMAERTHGLVGVGATCPSFRWHPAVVAQAAATLEAMYPGRHWLGIGSGEAISEHVVGGYWPEAPQRIARMFEAIEIIQKLFSGRDVRHDGKFFTLERTRLWTRPDVPPPVYVATSGPVTARRAGSVCDGIITVASTPEKVAALFSRFDEGARSVGKDPSSAAKIVQIHLSWAPDPLEAAAQAVREWPNGAMRFSKADIRSPHDIEQIARTVRAEDFEGQLLISADPDDHRREIQRYLDVGATHVYLHNAGTDQLGWLKAFGREVIPGLTP